MAACLDCRRELTSADIDALGQRIRAFNLAPGTGGFGHRLCLSCWQKEVERRSGPPGVDGQRGLIPYQEWARDGLLTWCGGDIH